MKGFTLSGKAILIAITVVAATGGFTLGYFVGKNTSSPSISGGTLPVIPKQPEISPVAPGTATLKGQAKEDVKTHPEERPADLPQTTKAEVSGPKSDTLRDTGREPKPTLEKRLYTVQVGAFKSQKDADSLKLKLEKKEYRAYVKKDLNSKGVPLFKVRIGEFTDKKKAEALAREMKKTQGLNAFATVKN
ncbi:MAG: hypothetical protein OHK0032_03130 [Thermodesulfovibrionales bacterium]